MASPYQPRTVVTRSIKSHPGILKIRHKRQRNRVIRSIRKQGIHTYLEFIHPYPVISLNSHANTP